MLLLCIFLKLSGNFRLAKHFIDKRRNFTFTPPFPVKFRRSKKKKIFCPCCSDIKKPPLFLKIMISLWQNFFDQCFRDGDLLASVTGRKTLCYQANQKDNGELKAFT